MKKNNYWDNLAKHYDNFIKKDNKAYEKIISKINENISNKNVLEIGTGTGIIAIGVAGKAKSVLATDFSSNMINQAKAKKHSKNLTFEIADATNLIYEKDTFDAVIISNCLHIMPNPKKVLEEIKKVLKKDGFLFAPNFCVKGCFKTKLMFIAKLLTGFKVHQNWTPNEYHSFVIDRGFKICFHETYKSSFPIEMVICKKN